MANPQFSTQALAELRCSLLAWYDQHRRDLPWRRTSDSYAIWISEIMLQQTRVAAVVERYEVFMRNFPTVLSLAHAAEQDVLALWSGLGYYRRARMLHEAAKAVAGEMDGKLPGTAAGLRGLPGIGPYTSAAIASIAFGEAVAVVDGNVERVVQRLAGWGSDSTAGQATLARTTDSLASTLLDPHRPGDHNQAMMELGATICIPRAPLCLQCPLQRFCATQGEHPTAPRAKMRSEVVGYALILRLLKEIPEILLYQRATELTVMPGMWELPRLRDTDFPDSELRMTVRHAIMQVNYSVRIRTVSEDDTDALTMPSVVSRWLPLSDVNTLPLTGLARKVLRSARLSGLAAAQ